MPLQRLAAGRGDGGGMSYLSLKHWSHPALLLTGLVVAMSACGPVGPVIPDLQPPLTPKEREAILTVQHAVQVSDDEGEDIWPGFHVAEVPLLIFRPGGRSFLVMALPESVPPFAQRIDFDGLEMPAWVFPSAEVKTSPRTPFSQDFPLGSLKVFLVRHDDTSAAEAFFRLTVHERFHHYQANAFRNRVVPKTCRFPYEDSPHAMLVCAEERLLAAMLSTKDADSFVEAVKKYFAQRKSRYLTPGGEKARGLEEWEETTEGTARYVEEKYALEGGYTTTEKIGSSIISYFSRFDPKTLQKWRYYRTGIAVALGLDALVEEVWKQRCEEGTCLFQLVMEGKEPDLAELPEPSTAEKLLSKGQMKDAAAALQEYLGQEAGFLEAWKKQGAYLVTLELNAPGNGYYTARGVTFAMEDCSRVVTAISSYVDRSFGLEVRNRTIRMVNRPGYTMLQFHHDLAPGQLLVDGAAWALSEGTTSFFSGTQIHLPELELNVLGCGRWEVGKDGVKLTLEALPGSPKCP